MAENTRLDATQRDANDVHCTCVCGPGCQCVNCVEARDGISQLEGQAENEGDRRIHAHKEEMDMDEYDSDYGIYAWGGL